MKKIFTLMMIASLYAGGGKAQDETWDAAELNFTVLKNEATFTATTTSVSLIGLSSPNDNEVAEGKAYWENKVNNDNLKLNTDKCDPKLTVCAIGKGNPALTHSEYDEDTENGTAHRVSETYWDPNCGSLPIRGAYYEVTFSQAGTFKAGCFINRPNSNIYILEKSTITLLAPSAISIEGFVQNNGFTWDSGESGPYATFSVKDDYTIDVGTAGNRQILAYVSFNAEAGKTYLMFNPKNQLGLYGFKFTPKTPTGINNIANTTENVNAPMYNLAGQQVTKSYKGVVIQNGHKFVNK